MSGIMPPCFGMSMGNTLTGETAGIIPGSGGVGGNPVGVWPVFGGFCVCITALERCAVDGAALTGVTALAAGPALAVGAALAVKAALAGTTVALYSCELINPFSTSSWARRESASSGVAA